MTTRISAPCSTCIQRFSTNLVQIIETGKRIVNKIDNYLTSNIGFRSMGSEAATPKNVTSR
jgi:hypothetical protein